jgi:hypothetical protein
MALEAGAAELREVAVRLRATGQVGLQRRMYRNIRLATAPAAERVRASAMASLPREGGLNEWVAESVIKTSVTSGVRSAGVTLRMRKTGHDLKKINEGVVRHPVYGNTKVWAVTNVQPGFFTRPLEAMRPEVTAACVAAMREAALEAGFR